MIGSRPWTVGQRNPKAKLDEKAVAVIRAKLSFGAVAIAVAREFDVSVSTIKRIKQGVLWPHVGGRVRLDPIAVERLHADVQKRRTNGTQVRAQRRTRCANGHALTGENLVIGGHANGDYRMCRECNRKRRRERYQQNPSARLRKNMARAVWGVLKRGSGGALFTRLGYSAEELAQHLESKFSSGMNWRNYGRWHVDHIRPSVMFDHTDAVQFSECWSLANLQPLWASENMRKGASYTQKVERDG
jgi:hypothetical protein